LGEWVEKQRQSYNEGTLSEERNTLLQEIGFVFEPGTNVANTIVSEAWKRNYQSLVQFKRDNGHVEVRTPHLYLLWNLNRNSAIVYQRNGAHPLLFLA
jgi:hypothetical protein